MLSIERLREIDPNLKNLSDKEIEEIRASFCGLGELIWDDWVEEQKQKGFRRHIESRRLRG